MFAAGRGMPADPVEAIKWHLISKAGGATDLKLDAFMRQQKPDVRAAAEKAAQPSIEPSRLARTRALDAAACGGQTALTGRQSPCSTPPSSTS